MHTVLCLTPAPSGSMSVGRAQPHRRARRLIPTSLPAEAQLLNIRNKAPRRWRGRSPAGAFPSAPGCRPVRNNAWRPPPGGESYPIRYPPSKILLFPAEIADFAVSVHHRLRLLAFPMRTGGCCRTVDREISRFPHKERLHMPGSLTTPGRPGARNGASGRVAFRKMHCVGIQNRKLSRLNGWPMRPLSTLRRGPRGQLRMTWGRCGSLLLHRKGLAPSTPCRSPGARISFPVCPRNRT